MSKNVCHRTIHRETGNHNRKPDIQSDEISLRDEILELKRQVMVLKRTNEQYAVKLRKCEDEAKRKDKQLEHLMNPRKNADVAKVLSVKGAAILMNLKDQNNALVQMLLNKDLHIRKLMAEIKMSKLYASSKKNGCYKAEISRLRNLQKTLRDNIDMQQQQKRSICVGGNSFFEFSSSSDQSSPRDLDEMRSIILSLESHIKYSNDLLAQKNKEISNLTDEVNFLRKYFRYKTLKNEAFDSEKKKEKFSTNYTWQNGFNTKKLSSEDLYNFFEKRTNNQDEILPHSAPAGPTSWYTPDELPTKDQFSLNPVENFEEESSKNSEESNSKLDKSLFQTETAEEAFNEKQTLSPPMKSLHTKGKWKNVLTKYKELKKLNPWLFTEDDQNQQFSKTENKFMVLEGFKSDDIQNGEVQNADGKVEQRNETPTESIRDLYEGLAKTTAKSSESSLSQDRNENICDFTSPSPEKNLLVENPSENPEEPKNSFLSQAEEDERRINHCRDIFRQRLNYSLGSESSCSNQEAHQVEVEVQINSVSPYSDVSQSESEKEDNENNLENEDDDDDVIVR